MSSISAGTTLGTGLVSEGDTTGELVLKTNGSTTAVTIGTDQNVTLAAGLTTTSPAVFPAGTASAPAITTTGDTNTGIFFPAADTIGLATGGAEAARLVSGLLSIPANSTTASAVRLYEDTDNGTNYVDLIAPTSVASNRTITFPDATTTVVGTDTTQTLTNKSIAATQLTGTIASTQLPAGSVLQVVSATKTNTFSTSGTTFVDITGISVSITPKAAANKILIMATISIGPDSGAASLTMRFVRDSTVIAIGDAAGNRPRGTGNAYCGDGAGDASYVPSAISFLDSPNTTSATTYKVQANSSTASTVYVNRTDRDANLSGYDARTVSTITVMEIAG